MSILIGLAPEPLFNAVWASAGIFQTKRKAQRLSAFVQAGLDGLSTAPGQLLAQCRAPITFIQ